MNSLKNFALSFRLIFKRRIKESINSVLKYTTIEELVEIIILLRKIESAQLNRLNNDEIIQSILKEDNELLNRLAK